MGDLDAADCNTNNVSAVIFDLDGTLLSTEQVSKGVLKEFLARYGKVPVQENENKRLGMTHKESATAIVTDYDLPLTPAQFSQEILPFYDGKWLQARALPGANRLLRHLHKHRVPFALASNSLRRNIDAKISHQPGWTEFFTVILGSDEVKAGKPSPDIFLEAASRLGIHAASCLVIEDSLIGVRAAKAAGMKVIAVPSLQTEADKYSIADYVIHSLLEFQPELWGLPSFVDWVGDALPIDPIHFKCLYSNGLLNISGEQMSFIPDQLFGLHIGWGKIGQMSIVKVVMSIGWTHDYGVPKRRILACIIHENEQLYDREMEVHVVGYVRRPSNKRDEDGNHEIGAEVKMAAEAILCLPEFSFGIPKSNAKCCSQD